MKTKLFFGEIAVKVTNKLNNMKLKLSNFTHPF